MVLDKKSKECAGVFILRGTLMFLGWLNLSCKCWKLKIKGSLKSLSFLLCGQLMSVHNPKAICMVDKIFQSRPLDSWLMEGNTPLVVMQCFWIQLHKINDLMAETEAMSLRMAKESPKQNILKKKRYFETQLEELTCQFYQKVSINNKLSSELNASPQQRHQLKFPPKCCARATGASNIRKGRKRSLVPYGQQSITPTWTETIPQEIFLLVTAWKN